MRIDLTSIMVEDQEKALAFYTGILGFDKETDMPMEDGRVLTVVSLDDRGGAELLLKSNGNPFAKGYQKAFYDQRIPAISFGVDDIAKEYERLTERGVHFLVAPTEEPWGWSALFDDTCGNVIGLHQIPPSPRGTPCSAEETATSDL